MKDLSRKHGWVGDIRGCIIDVMVEQEKTSKWAKDQTIVQTRAWFEANLWFVYVGLSRVGACKQRAVCELDRLFTKLADNVEPNGNGRWLSEIDGKVIGFVVDKQTTSANQKSIDWKTRNITGKCKCRRNGLFLLKSDSWTTTLDCISKRPWNSANVLIKTFRVSTMQRKNNEINFLHHTMNMKIRN